MTGQEEPGAEWRARRSFANADPRAVKLTELLHQARKPQLTILFGSRARGDYAEGRSDVDIMLVEEPPPEGEATGERKLAFLKDKAQIYRGQDIECQWLLRTPEEFRERTKFVNSLETSALEDGYVLGGEAERYTALARMWKTNSRISRAKRHAEYLENRCRLRQRRLPRRPSLPGGEACADGRRKRRRRVVPRDMRHRDAAGTGQAGRSRRALRHGAGPGNLHAVRRTTGRGYHRRGSSPASRST